MIGVIQKLDKVANALEDAGLLKEAMDIDVLSNTIEALEKEALCATEDPVIKYLNMAISTPQNSLMALERINGMGTLSNNSAFKTAYNILKGGCDSLPRAHRDAKRFIQEALKSYSNKGNASNHRYTYFT